MEELASKIWEIIVGREDVDSLDDTDYVEFLDQLSEIIDVNAQAKRDELGLD
jgi:hypothetical protein